MKVFVYGTLKQGYGNNAILAEAKFMGRAETNTHYSMLDGGFPYMLLPVQGHAYPVVGELFDIGKSKETLARLDRLESNGSHYDRIEGYVMCDNKLQLASYYVKHEHGREIPERKLMKPVNGKLEWRG